MRSVTVERTAVSLVREPLVRPFGFKGMQINELWQTVVKLSSCAHTAVCPSTQSVLWADADVFSMYSQDESNMLMHRTTRRALELIEGRTFERPDRLIKELIPELREYADAITGTKVKETFVLNSLVGVDLALWSLYAKENGINSFEGIIPEEARDAMSRKHSKLAHIPLVSYNVGEKEIRRLLDNGTALMKIKVGKELGWDKERLISIHDIAKGYETPLTTDGNVKYYLDANGRYTPEELDSVIDFASEKGFLDRIAVIEEPFAEEDETDVSRFPVVINADESAHSAKDLKGRIALGYRSVALKPIAKTLSVSFEMAREMHAAGGSCLCADLTVNPLLAEWNKQFAAAIAPLPGMNAGCVEVNGDENYKNWKEQIKRLPEGLPYSYPRRGAFCCTRRFYAKSGGLFENNGWDFE